MATLALLRDPPKWLIAVGSSLLTAIAALWLSYSDFRAKRIEQNSAATEASIQSSIELRPILDRFILAINDKATLTPEDRTKLTQAVRQAYDRAEDVRNRFGRLDEEFKAYSSALVDLKDAGDKLVNSYSGGKQFMLAYSKWIVADENWRKEVQRRQNSYVASFRF